MTWMRKRDHGVLTNTASLLVCGLLAGIVVAAAAFPVVAVSGLAAKASVDAFDNLPSTLTELPPPQISYVYASDAKTLLAMFYDENRRDVHLTDVAPVMQQAIVAAEDQRFYEHHGVDIKGVARAAVANGNSSGQVSQGASTLTQQYVRQALTYSARTNEEIVAATEQTPARKLREMKYALALEKKYNKQQILERYLNISSFGHGAYGIYAASQVYFGKDPKDLTLAEASLLAGLVKAPSSFDPADPDKLPAALQRRDYVLRQMVALKYITQQQADEAKAVKLNIVGKRSPEGCASMPAADIGAGFFCDFLYRWWLDQPAFGADAFERENKLKSGGYKIISSLDVGTQSALKRNVEKSLATGSPYAIMTAAVEPGTGRVLGLATNRNFSNDQSHNGPNTNPYKKGQVGNYPNTTAPLLTGGGDILGYQAGSTFKIFTMVAALEKGYTLDYTINTVSPYEAKKYIVDSHGEAACKGTSYYCVVNATPSWMNGPRNMWTGFGRSVNTYFIPLEERAGAANAVDVAKRLGIQFRAHGTQQNPSDYEYANNPDLTNSWGPFTLGVSATTPLDLANAYATLAADGTYCAPTPITEIRDMDDNKLDLVKPQCRQVVTPDVARAAVDAARCPLGDQSAFGRCDGATSQEVHGIVQRPVAGKTGTTDGNKTATLVAMTKQIAMAGILGDPDTPLTNRLAADLGGDPHKYVNKAIEYALHDAMANKPAVNFTPPSKEIAFGKSTSVPAVACRSVDDAKGRLRTAGFDVTVDPDPVPSNCPPGTVARTDPAGEASSNGVITLFLSKGAGNQAPAPDNGPGQGTGPARNQDPRCKIIPALCRTG